MNPCPPLGAWGSAIGQTPFPVRRPRLRATTWRGCDHASSADATVRLGAAHNDPHLVVADDPAIEDADRITIEAWSTRSPGQPERWSAEGRAATSSTTSAAGFPGTSSDPTTGCSTTSRARLGTAAGAISSAPTTRTPGPNNQRLYLNGTRVAQMSDTLPIDLNSAALGIGRHVSGIADPFNGHIDEFRLSQRPAVR
jgi:Concanavalin A-like lectin/glucanases superfamily